MSENENELVYVPLGGVGEIGMNMGLYGYGPGRNKQWIMVDCGVTFGHASETPGVDLILPNITFALGLKENLLALILTHAHEDHYGAVLDLWPQLKVPLVATPFTANLLTAKAAGERHGPQVPVQVVQQGGKVAFGPFSVEFVPVAHSIPEANALAIRTPAGLVVHTGDWKIDPQSSTAGTTDEAKFRALGDEGVIAVIGDSTNATREGFSPSETEVASNIAELIRSAPARVAVTTFASHIPRLRTVAEAAFETGREVVVVGRAMERTVAVARETGWLDGIGEFRSPDVFGYLPPEKALLLLTGSQGEPRAALARIASGDHPEISLSKRDRVIFSSRTIPGNEREVGRIINSLIDREIEVVTDNDHLVHVSGHPRRGEMAQLYSWLRPAAVVPVHGEALHLNAHEQLARSLGIENIGRVRNGQVLKLFPGKPEIVGKVPSGRVFKDGNLLLSSEEPVRERKRLAFAGMVSVALAVDARGDLVGDPEVDLSGLPDVDADKEKMADIVYDAVLDVVESLPKARRRDRDSVADAVRRAVRAEVNAAWGKKPFCHVLVIGV
ncbi:ribonuclease J [Terrihabitans rhizophilus]|jgi:ribonuclease J|uniref:Ribonuclease J n=1 Tax=Terrihabitans rhizophilus TaxID=3092662 RepID=A0ABU4RLL0_9HYPH|nr:ribonuclease J [Terrihabitans sp. PJ23]MDX6805481.1 ribonuclease J [Terrihabitans sp. PJ23]